VPTANETITVTAGTVITWTCDTPPGNPAVQWAYRDSSAGSRGSGLQPCTTADLKVCATWQ